VVWVREMENEVLCHVVVVDLLEAITQARNSKSKSKKKIVHNTTRSGWMVATVLGSTCSVYSNASGLGVGVGVGVIAGGGVGVGVGRLGSMANELVTRRPFNGCTGRKLRPTPVRVAERLMYTERILSRASCVIDTGRANTIQRLHSLHRGVVNEPRYVKYSRRGGNMSARLRYSSISISLPTERKYAKRSSTLLIDGGVVLPSSNKMLITTKASGSLERTAASIDGKREL
jgi:hypothetical protein